MPDRPLNYADDLDLMSPADAPGALDSLEQVAAAGAVRSLGELLERGKTRGSVTQEEIMQLALQQDDNADKLAEIIEALAKAGVAITDELVDDEFALQAGAEPGESFADGLAAPEPDLDEFEADLAAGGAPGAGAASGAAGAVEETECR